MGSRHWTAAEDRRLITAHREGGFSGAVKAFGGRRSNGAIRDRISRLELDARSAPMLLARRPVPVACSADVSVELDITPRQASEWLAAHPLVVRRGSFMLVPRCALDAEKARRRQLTIMEFVPVEEAARLAGYTSAEGLRRNVRSGRLPIRALHAPATDGRGSNRMVYHRGDCIAARGLKGRPLRGARC